MKIVINTEDFSGQTTYSVVDDQLTGITNNDVANSVVGVLATMLTTLCNTRENALSTLSVIEEDLRNDLANYNIELVATAIEDIDFSDEFTNAAEAKVTAQQNKLTAQTQQETANLEAQAAAERQVIQAQADADSAIIAAQGDAEVAQIAADSAEYQGQKDAAIMSNLGKMLQQYPELIDYYKATGWDGKLPETMLGDDVNYFIGQ